VAAAGGRRTWSEEQVWWKCSDASSGWRRPVALEPPSRIVLAVVASRWAWEWCMSESEVPAFEVAAAPVPVVAAGSNIVVADDNIAGWRIAGWRIVAERPVVPAPVESGRPVGAVADAVEVSGKMVWSFDFLASPLDLVVAAAAAVAAVRKEL
jgi:hypothetical protein